MLCAYKALRKQGGQPRRFPLRVSPCLLLVRHGARLEEKLGQSLSRMPFFCHRYQVLRKILVDATVTKDGSGGGGGGGGCRVTRLGSGSGVIY